jgi:xanthine dehydrogenase/oxidase
MPRKQNALAIVNAGFLLDINANNTVKFAKIVYGNISPDFIHATKTENYLIGKNIYNDGTLQGAINLLKEEINPNLKPPHASPECRKKLAIGLFYKVRM